MISGEDASFNGALSRFPEDQTRGMIDCQGWGGGKGHAAGFSGIQTNMIDYVAANTQIDYNQTSSSTDPLIDLFETQSYVSLIESSGLPFYRSQESSGDGGLDIFPLNLLISNEENVSSETYMNINQAELQQSLQAVDVNHAHGIQANLKGEMGISYFASTSMMSTTTKPESSQRVPEKLKKRSEIESCRRSLISQKVQVLHDDLPETLKDKRPNQISILHDIIGHIKYLQLQVKELSKSRLATKSDSLSLMFVEQGDGYYHPDANKFDEPLDDFLRSLFEEDPDVAHKVLENYGLYTVPMASFYEFLCSTATG